MMNLGNIIGRMCAPRSEHTTDKWLKKRSALGELIEFEKVQEIFRFTPTVTLYDLTNTSMKGNALNTPKAKRGRSKEKRTDCPLVTLGLALDASGFIRHSKVFDDNVAEGKTLKEMLKEINETFRKRYEEGLKKSKKGSVNRDAPKKRNAVNERIGRLKEKGKRVSAHYRIEMTEDKSKDIITSLTWYYEPTPDSKPTNLGVYKLRTCLTDWDDAILWRTYTMLTDLESVFQSLKSELGLRPVYHQKEERCDGKILHVRQASQPEEELKEIYKKLKLTPEPGGVKK